MILLTGRRTALGRRWRAASLRRAAGYPGPTRTAHARRYSPDNSRENRRMPPETLAEHIFRAVERKQRVLIPSPANQAFALAGTWLPAITEAAMRQSIFEKLP